MLLELLCSGSRPGMECLSLSHLHVRHLRVVPICYKSEEGARVKERNSKAILMLQYFLKSKITEQSTTGCHVDLRRAENVT